ncbi:hypothetical protein U0070_010938 [Myodes glareolus]
MGVH